MGCWLKYLEEVPKSRGDRYPRCYSIFFSTRELVATFECLRATLYKYEFPTEDHELRVYRLTDRTWRASETHTVIGSVDV